MRRYYDSSTPKTCVTIVPTKFIYFLIFFCVGGVGVGGAAILQLFGTSNLYSPVVERDAGLHLWVTFHAFEQTSQFGWPQLRLTSMDRSNPFTGQNLLVFEAAFVYPVPNKHIAHGDKSLQPFSIHSSQQSGHRNSFFTFLFFRKALFNGGHKLCCSADRQTNEASFKCLTMCLISELSNCCSM